MNEVEPVRGVLITHGAMAEGMVDAVRRIAGVDGDALFAVSNEGCSPDALLERLESTLEDRPAVIFTDLPMGSCAVAARVACARPGARGVVFGVNLAMLLDFVFHRDLPLEELIPRLVARGRDAVQGQIPRAACADPPLPR